MGKRVKGVLVATNSPSFISISPFPRLPISPSWLEVADLAAARGRRGRRLGETQADLPLGKFGGVGDAGVGELT